MFAPLAPAVEFLEQTTYPSVSTNGKSGHPFFQSGGLDRLDEIHAVPGWYRLLLLWLKPMLKR